MGLRLNIGKKPIEKVDNSDLDPQMIVDVNGKDVTLDMLKQAYIAQQDGKVENSTDDVVKKDEEVDNSSSASIKDVIIVLSDDREIRLSEMIDEEAVDKDAEVEEVEKEEKLSVDNSADTFTARIPKKHQSTPAIESILTERQRINKAVEAGY